VPPGCVAAGNPARVMSTVEESVARHAGRTDRSLIN
jgi:acetyltransferase-like isoleucine patch superfamily enzyme